VASLQSFSKFDFKWNHILIDSLITMAQCRAQSFTWQACVYGSLARPSPIAYAVEHGEPIERSSMQLFDFRKGAAGCDLVMSDVDTGEMKHCRT
jgi:hypothetical protein